MAAFCQSAFMEALGWSLLDSLWKMGILWIAYTSITGNGKWLSADRRYSLAALLMTVGILWSFTGVIGNYQKIIAGKEISTLAGYFKNRLGVYLFTELVMPYVSTAYIIMALFFSCRLIYQHHSIKVSLTKDLIEAGDSVNHLLNDLIERIRIRKNISVWLSEFVDTPLTIGFLNPMILLPIAALNQLTIEQAKSVIAHELFHIRRNDYLANALFSFSAVMLFFNPFSRLFQHTIQKEREHVCDDEVMAMGFNQWQYAHALYTLGKYNSVYHSFAMAAVGSEQLLLERVSRIMNTGSQKRHVKTIDQRVPTGVLKPALTFFLCVGFSLFLKNPKKTIVPKAMHSERPANNNVHIVYQKTTIFPTNEAPAIVRPRRVIRLKKSFAVSYGESKQAPAFPDGPPAPGGPHAPVGVMSNSFVSAQPERTEFTLLQPRIPVAPTVKVILEQHIPYFPSSTFYYSNVEDSLTKPGKRTVHL